MQVIGYHDYHDHRPSEGRVNLVWDVSNNMNDNKLSVDLSIHIIYIQTKYSYHSSET